MSRAPEARGLLLRALDRSVFVRAARADGRPVLDLDPDGPPTAERLRSTGGFPERKALVRLGEEVFEVTAPSVRDSAVSGRVAVVTGAAQGIGAELAAGLAADGARVFVADRNLAGARETASRLGPLASALEVDVSDKASVEAMFAEVAADVGGVDLVVSNAGVVRAGALLDQPVSEFEFTTAVNYTGFFLVARHGAALMARQRLAGGEWWGDIVQINSKSGLVGSNRNAAYAGSKFGGIGLVQSFALELVAHRIKVNAICPGNFLDGPLWSDPETGLFVQYLRSGKVPGATTVAQVRAHYESLVPMGRGVRVEDVLRALRYLVEQRYETGQALPVTGGQIMMR